MQQCLLSLAINNLKNCDKVWGKIEKLMKINFESKPVYGDDNKYIKSKKKNYTNYSIRHGAKKLTDTLIRKSIEHFYTIYAKSRKLFNFCNT